MNNEPVAWYKKNSNDYLIENIGQPSFQIEEFIDAGYIPLYAHPAELTDEEIWEVIDNCFGVHAFNLDYQIALDEAREDAFESVKATLRKAQEK